MEPTYQQINKTDTSEDRLVSILILMEPTYQQKMLHMGHTANTGFNPYFNGTNIST